MIGNVKHFVIPDQNHTNIILINISAVQDPQIGHHDIFIQTKSNTSTNTCYNNTDFFFQGCNSFPCLVNRVLLLWCCCDFQCSTTAELLTERDPLSCCWEAAAWSLPRVHDPVTQRFDRDTSAPWKHCFERINTATSHTHYCTEADEEMEIFIYKHNIARHSQTRFILWSTFLAKC